MTNQEIRDALNQLSKDIKNAQTEEEYSALVDEAMGLDALLRERVHFEEGGR